MEADYHIRQGDTAVAVVGMYILYEDIVPAVDGEAAREVAGR